LPHPVLLISRDRRILAANKIACDVGAKVGGLCWLEYGHGDFIPEEDKKKLSDPGASFSEGTKCTFCLSDECLKGFKTTTNQGVKIFDRSKDIWWVPIDEKSYLHYTIDITERKQVEEELKRHRDNLEDLVAERTKALQSINQSLEKEIDEHKQTEKALKKAEEKYRSIFENSIEGIFQTTPDGRFLMTNPAMARLLGYQSPEELIQSVTDISSQLYVNADRRKELIRQLRDQGEVKLFEDQYYRKDGTTFWALANVRIIRNSKGENLYLEGTVEDITSRKQIEEERQVNLEKLNKAIEGIIQTLASTGEVRDPYTAGHQKRVADLATFIGKEMGLAEERLGGLRTAGLIHDIGKIAVPAEILSNPSKLSEIEFNLIKVHPETGFDIIKDIDFPWPLAEMVLQHHERLDGSGYPRGLKGEDISLEARILAVADVVEAIASDRPYRPSLGINVALAEIEEKKGIFYDPDVVE
ncbi:MAG: hypothetical protein C0407_16845, partial [Desulfobacca sp.]|nr:hypothetical protein [Desulfobacca sp.]